MRGRTRPLIVSSISLSSIVVTSKDCFPGSPIGEARRELPAEARTLRQVRRKEALFHRLLLDPVAALCNGNDPDWRRYICGTEERCIGLVIGEILINAPERVLG
jgi:hypothetical protein